MAADESRGFAKGEEQCTSWWRRVLREPLLHFFLLGTVLFVVSNYFGDTTSAPEDNQIVVTEAKVRSLAGIFQRTWQRPPTQQELDGLIADYVNEEVFYREALTMGLDQDDTLIRRRLRQKLEFVAEDLADAVEPTDEELQSFLTEHPERFREEGRTTFSQIYFNPQRRGDSLKSDLQQAVQALGEDAVNAAEIGDPLLLPMFHKDLRDTEIANLMGRQFAAKLEQLEADTWAGPVESGYGVHLVKVHQRKPGRLPDLEEVRDAVRREWFAERRAESKQQFYDSLRERYEVTVEMPAQEQPVDAIGETAEADSP